MLLTVAIVVVVLIAAVLVIAALKPASFRYERSASIKATPQKIFPLIDDFHRWKDWSPWEKLDPALQRTYSGAPSGKGAIYEWQGSKKVGSGRMEITDSRPATKVLIKLDFISPFEAHNTAEFTLTPQGGATQVTWAMYGPSPFMPRLMSVFMNMEKMLGKSFDEGLASLKALAE
jgi:hypothetical protein